MPVKIYQAAQARLIEIWDYTERTWGEKQADAYIRELVAAANHIPAERHHWHPLRERTLPGIFFVRHKHHFIFFRELPDGSLGVISFLHEEMNLPTRLLEDAA